MLLQPSLLIGAIVGIFWWAVTSWAGTMLGRDVPAGPVSERTTMLLLAGWIVLTIAAVIILNKRFAGFLLGFFFALAGGFLVFFVRSLIAVP